jgi:HlyD family type I secretion membrane fusion protein
MTHLSSRTLSVSPNKTTTEASHFQTNACLSKQGFVTPLDEDDFIPPVSHWASIGGIFLLCTTGIMVALSAITPSPVTVQAIASVRPSGETKIVQALMEGTIKTLEVQETQRVELGQVIARIDNTPLQTGIAQLKKAIEYGEFQIQSLEKQRFDLNLQIIAEQNLMRQTIRSAQSEFKRVQGEYSDKQAIAVREVQEAQANLDAAKIEFDAYENARIEGAIANIQVEIKRQAYLAAIARLKRAQQMLSPTKAAMDVAQGEVEQSRSKGESSLATLQRTIESLLQQKAQLQVQVSESQKDLQKMNNDLLNTLVRAPVSGTILELRVRNEGQFVRLGDIIAQISPEKKPLVVKARVTPQDVGKVRIGHEVVMRVSAYAYTDYGILKGKVMSISADAITLKASNQGIYQTQDGSTETSYFEVVIEPEKTFLLKSENKYEIQPGMEVKVDIISDEESMFIFILRKARLFIGT